LQLWYKGDIISDFGTHERSSCVRVLVFNNDSGDTGVAWQNHRTSTRHCQTLSHKVNTKTLTQLDLSWVPKSEIISPLYHNCNISNLSPYYFIFCSFTWLNLRVESPLKTLLNVISSWSMCSLAWNQRESRLLKHYYMGDFVRRVCGELLSFFLSFCLLEIEIKCYWNMDIP
jgi:hypothetical protein